MEIERKFLIKKTPANLESFEKKSISQAYISTSPVIRIRRTDDEYYLTVKSNGLLAREEFELPVTADEFISLSGKAETAFLEKDRYIIPLEDGLTAEFDVYHGFLNPLMTVEVEFSSTARADAFLPPDWFGLEVTMDGRYANSSLIKHGLPDELND